MKKHVFKIISFSLLIVLIGSIFYYHREMEKLHLRINQLEDELEEEEPDFNESFVKNGKFNSYCPITLDNGEKNIENISEYCLDENLPPRSLEVSLSHLELLEEDEAIGVLTSRVEQAEEEFELVAFSKNAGHYTSKTLDEKPLNLKLDEDFITLEFEEEQKRYRLIGSEFESVEEEFKKVTSPDFGFSLEIPESWKVEKGEESYLFRPTARDLHYLKLETEGYDLSASENNPYELEKERVEESLEVNELESLPDYGKFEENLEDYLKIDTTKGQITYHKDGEKEEFDILASGDPTGWNGTPAGLYEIHSKEGLRFSTESEVYMPYSMRLYGKYLIHGEAYFPSGLPYESAVSGGCVRVRNEEMSDLYEMVETGTPVLSITHRKSEFGPEETGLPALPNTQAESFLVADLNSGKVFADKNPTERRPIASITKLMTATVVAEQIGNDTTLTVQDYMLDGYGETRGIYAGRVVRMADLLRPLLIESSNDAAKVLAHFLGRDNTLDRMNQKAASIGMEDSEFVESSGFDEGNVSTARDIYYMLYYLRNARRPILDITAEEWVPDVNHQAFTGLENKISFYDHESFVGGKTGYIPESDYGGAFVFEVDFDGKTREVAFVLLGAPSRTHLEEEAFELKDWLKRAYN